MSLLILLTIILVTSLVTGSVLCYAVFILLKKVRMLEQTLSESKSIMQSMSDVQRAELEEQKGKNPLWVILSKKKEDKEDKDEPITGPEAIEGNKTIH